MWLQYRVSIFYCKSGVVIENGTSGKMDPVCRYVAHLLLARVAVEIISPEFPPQHDVRARGAIREELEEAEHVRWCCSKIVHVHGLG